MFLVLFIIAVGTGFDVGRRLEGRLDHVGWIEVVGFIAFVGLAFFRLGDSFGRQQSLRALKMFLEDAMRSGALSSDADTIERMAKYVELRRDVKL